ncbi:MAG TPA: hypothetical protein VFW71_02340 [Actinomycetota bacterium]|nr:hypothetical protein [Actinomycetota bacterium]
MRPLVPALCLGIAVTLAACSASPKAPQSTPTPTPTPSVSASPSALPTQLPASPAIGCTIVTPDEVNAALRTTVGVPTVDHPSQAETDCTFTGPGQLVTVDVIVGETAASFAADKSQLTANQTWADVAGVGDQAYYVTLASQYGTTIVLYALKGSNAFVTSAQTDLRTLEMLMNQVLAHATSK